MTKTTNITRDYNAKLAEDTAAIRDKVRRSMLPLVARIPAIDRAASEYVLAQDAEFERKRAEMQAEGKSVNLVPIQLRDSDALGRLADLVMYEELTWSHPDKMSIVEYPVMSEWQEELRAEKTSLVGVVEYGDLRYLGKKKAAHEDGSYGKKTHRRIIPPDDPQISHIESVTALEEALAGAGLSNRQRQAIDLVYFEGLTQVEAAAEMGISKSNISAYISVSLRKLRDYMTISR